MSIKLSSEQIQFKDVARSFLEGEVTSEYLRKRIDAKHYFDPQLRVKFLELGFFTSFTSGAEEGLDLTFLDLALLAGEAGRVLLPEPLIQQIFCAPYILTKLSTEDERKALKSSLGAEEFSKIVSGETEIAVSLAPIDCGSKKINLPFMCSSANSKYAVIPTQSGVYLVDLGKKELSAPSALLDLTRASQELNLELKGAQKISSLNAENFNELFAILAASEMSGACEKVVEMTTQYVKDRTQFNVPIGGFQAVQHKLADMYLSSEALRALSRFAAWAVDNSKEQVALSARAAISFACENAAQLVESAIQLHGGIGFTWEYDLHLYLRRIKTIEAFFKGWSGAEGVLAAAQRS